MHCRHVVFSCDNPFDKRIGDLSHKPKNYYIGVMNY